MQHYCVPNLILFFACLWFTFLFISTLLYLLPLFSRVFSVWRGSQWSSDICLCYSTSFSRFWHRMTTMMLLLPPQGRQWYYNVHSSWAHKGGGSEDVVKQTVRVVCCLNTISITFFFLMNPAFWIKIFCFSRENMCFSTKDVIIKALCYPVSAECWFTLLQSAMKKTWITTCTPISRYNKTLCIPT